MPGIVIPADRTTRTQPRGYCLAPECREASDAERFEFDVQHDRFECPKCGRRESPTVGLLVLTHLLLADRCGPILGSGGRYRLACHEKRAYLATATNLEAATGEPRIANCPDCLAASHKLGIYAAQGVALS